MIKKIAFVVPEFPAVSQTWLLSQVTGLIDQGIEVDIFTLKVGSTEKIDDSYHDYKLANRLYSLDFPENRWLRVVSALPKLLHIFFLRPRLLPSLFNTKRYGPDASSLKLLFRVYPFLGKEKQYDLVHCHFGTVSNKFIPVKEVLDLQQTHLCTFYGYDISHIPQEKSADVYENVMRHFKLFLVMSENMKKRTVALGFPSERILVHPISIDIDSYNFTERKLAPGEPIKLSSVGRFVEKKGFDDLLRALAIVKQDGQSNFHLDLVGDGDLNDELRALAKELDIEDVVNFKGFLKLEEIKAIYDATHIYLQPSKTAADGDME